MTDWRPPESNDPSTRERPKDESFIIPFLGMIVMGLLVLAMLSSPAMILIVGALAGAGYAWVTRHDEPAAKSFAIIVAPLFAAMGLELASGPNSGGTYMMLMLFITIPVGIVVANSGDKAESRTKPQAPGIKSHPDIRKGEDGD